MFEDNIEIAYCPPEFQDNCANFLTYCKSCAAYCNTNKQFKYKPFKQTDEIHPYYIKQQEDRKTILKEKLEEKKASKNTELAKNSRRYNRQGKVIERKVIKSIDGAKLTSASGMINRDSDGYILLGDSKLTFSHKQRFSKRNELGPTSKEWLEGKGEGADIWLTTSDTYGTIVTMPKSVFDELIQLIKEKNA